jgi:poly(A) polymerase
VGRGSKDIVDWLIRVLGAARSIKDAVEKPADFPSSSPAEAARSESFVEADERSSEDFNVSPIGPAAIEPAILRPVHKRAKTPSGETSQNESPAPMVEEATSAGSRSGQGARASLQTVGRSASQSTVNPLEEAKQSPQPERHKHRFANRLLDRDAVDVVRRLRRHDHAAYLVGGCVRDLYLGLAPKDFDVSTSASPEEIKKVFRNCRIIGRRFRLAHIYFRGGKIIETATFRGTASSDDQEEQDLLIKRDNVWGSEEEDALRRDFTINGLMYNTGDGVIIDHVGGMSDLDKRVIRTIGDPDVRLQEDPVRILRAVRFSAKLDFEIETKLKTSMIAYAAELQRCATARILEETLKLFRTGYGARSVEILMEINALGLILPQLALFLSSPTNNQRTVQTEQVFGYLRALDELVKERGQVSDAVILTTILMVAIQEKLDEIEPRQHIQALTAIIFELTEEMLLTRRIKERTRQMLLAQKHLVPTMADQRPRRRVSPKAMLKRSYFADALDFFEICAKHHGEAMEQVTLWRQRAGEFESEVGDGDVREENRDEPQAPRRKRRRRRRGGTPRSERE